LLHALRYVIYWCNMSYITLEFVLCLNREGQSKGSRNSSTTTVLCTMSSYPLGRKRRYKWQGQWFQHHDNAPSHTALVVQQFLSEKIIPVIIQVLYSPDLYQPWRTLNRMRMPNSGRFQRKPFAGAPNNGRIDGGSCVCAQGSYCEGH
jgi:hypothetical protein